MSTRTCMALLIGILHVGLVGMLAGAETNALDRTPPSTPPAFSTEPMPADWAVRSAAVRKTLPAPSSTSKGVELVVTGVASDSVAAQLGIVVGEVIESVGGHALGTRSDWDHWRNYERRQTMAVRMPDGTHHDIALPEGRIGMDIEHVIKMESLLTPARRDPRWDEAFQTAIAAWNTDPDLALLACRAAADAGFPDRDLLHLVAAMANWRAQQWLACLDHGSCAEAKCPRDLFPVLIQACFIAAICSGNSHLAARMLEEHPMELEGYQDWREDLDRMSAPYAKSPRPKPPEEVTKDWPYDDLLLRSTSASYMTAWRLDQFLDSGFIDLNVENGAATGITAWTGAETVLIDAYVWIKHDQKRGLIGNTWFCLEALQGDADARHGQEGDLVQVLDLGIDQRGHTALKFGEHDAVLNLPNVIPVDWHDATRVRITTHAGWCQVRIGDESLYDGPLPGPPGPLTVYIGADGAHSVVVPAVTAPMRPDVARRHFTAVPDERGRLGMTLLHRVAYRGDLAMAKLLLDCKASPTIANDYGITPLHFAACGGSVEMAKLLVEAKADVNAKDVRGRTPIDLAVETHHDEFAAYLRSKGGTGKPPPEPKAAVPKEKPRTPESEHQKAKPTKPQELPAPKPPHNPLDDF